MKQEPEDLQDSGYSEPKSQPNSNIHSIEQRKPPRSGMSRRAFLGVTAATAAAATAGYVLKRPEFSLVSPPDNIYEEITEDWVATSCLNCPTRCATKVRVVNGHAVRIASNPLSKVSDGETCPRSHIGLQVLYNPNRVDGPLKRTNSQKGKGIDPGWAPISWGEALSEIGAHLKSLRSGGQPHKLLLLLGLNSTSNDDLIHRFASAYGTPNVVSENALDNEAEKVGEWMADGHYTHSAYDLKHTNYILSFGAGIVESQKPLSRNLRMWGHMRRERPNRAKVVMVDPRYSVTAAKADEWIPINPGTDGALAMAIANVIIDEGLYDASFIEDWTFGFDEYKALVLSDYGPDRVAVITGVDADVIRRIAREFARTKPAIAWRGRGATCWPNGSYTSYAIFCLNALVGSIDIPGGVLYQENPDYCAGWHSPAGAGPAEDAELPGGERGHQPGGGLHTGEQPLCRRDGDRLQQQFQYVGARYRPVEQCDGEHPVLCPRLPCSDRDG
jgi:thiosulfate reductase/polysulfide reductase chain A